MSNNRGYATIGTVGPIHITQTGSSKVVRPGKDYFFVKVHDAQVAFTGHIWDRCKGLVVTSQVNLNHPILGNEALRAIQRVYTVRKNEAQSLGLKSDLISLVPASMTHVSISIEFILDKANRLSDMASLVNDDGFLSTISLAPGAAMAAKTIGGLAQKVIQHFIPPGEHEPILRFKGDFNLGEDDLKEGYHVILGTKDKDNPIPDPLPKLEVRDEGLVVGGRRITQLSYVVLEVRHSPARTRGLHNKAPWEIKLREAQDEAELLEDDPFVDDEQKKQTWEKCKRLIQEAQALLRADSNYLRQEADDIWKSVYRNCKEAILGREDRGNGVVKGWQPDSRADRTFLGIPEDEDMGVTLGAYAEKVMEARRIFQEAGI